MRCKCGARFETLPELRYHQLSCRKARLGKPVRYVESNTAAEVLEALDATALRTQGEGK